MGITEKEWGEVYAKAWVDEKFRSLLENDPTAALKQFASDAGKNWDTLVAVPPKPGGAAADTDENCIHLVSCC